VDRSLVAINVRDEIRWQNRALAWFRFIADRARHAGAAALAGVWVTAAP